VNDSVGEHPIHPRGYATLHSGRWATVLEEEDAGFTGVNLEPRAPFLDLRVLRFLFRVPPVPWCVDKFLLREVMKPSLPEEIQRRPKSPLAEDPLDASIRLEKWRPWVPARPPALIHQFVNWQNWTETLRNSKGSLTAVHVRSFALLRWLKDVENG
jgi:Asparagine synthase